MRILTGSEAADRLEGLIHAGTQVGETGVDLTVGEVFSLTGPGSLDFGGSEEEAAPREALEPRRADPEDDYGWWELGPGSYLVVYNEQARLRDGELARIEPLPRLQRAGADHGSWSVTGSTDELASLLTVSPVGCRLKENCRLSLWTVFFHGLSPRRDERDSP